MKCRGELRIVTPDPATARAALAPDDDARTQTVVEADALLITCTATSPLGLLRSLDDVLVCLRALE